MTRKPKDRGHFNVVDLPTLRQWCLRYDADTVAILLCMAMGTDATGLLSSWTREPIRRRIPMSWRKIDQKLARVESDGVISWQDKSSRRNRIRLKLYETRVLKPGYFTALEWARRGNSPASPKDMRLFEKMAADGWLDADFRAIEQRKVEPVYLPLSLVGDERGMPTATPCILERIRRARDPLAFLLLAQMYAAQDLPENGGTAWDFIWQAFDEEKVIYRTAETAIVSATGRREWTRFSDVTDDHRKARDDDDAARYFDRMKILQDAGAVEFVLSVVEDDQSGAQAIYPLGVLRQGKLDTSAPEHAVGLLAIAAGLALSGDADKLDHHLDQAPYSWRVPVDRMYRKAAIRGIPRLVARPRTSATARWQAERIDLCRHWCEYFSGVIRNNAPEMLDQSGRLQCEFNETSTSLQCDLNDLPESANHTAASAARHDDEAA
jgi:hypothetical protein